MIQVAARIPRRERNGHENNHQRQRRRQHRQHDLFRGFDRCLLRLEAFLFDVANNILQHHDGIIDHNAHRQRQRQQGHVIEREIHHLQQRECGDDRRRNGQSGDDHRTQITDKQQDHQAGQQAAKQKMLLERSNGSFDECGVVANHLNGDSRGQRTLELIDFCLRGVDDFESVGACLPANIENHGFFAADHVPGGGLGEAIFHASHVSHANRRAVDVGHDDVIEEIGGFDATQRAHAHFRRPAPNGPAGNFHILVLNRAFQLIDGDAVSVELLRIAKNANLPDTPAGQVDFTDAVDRFQCPLDLLVRDFRGFAQIGAAGDQQRKNRIGVGIIFGNRGRENRGRQKPDGRRHFLSNVLRGALGIALQNEFASDPGFALISLRREFVKTADRAYRLFQRKDDLGAHLFRRRAGKVHGDRYGGRIGFREEVYA